MSQIFAVVSSLLVGAMLAYWIARFSRLPRDRVLGIAGLVVWLAATAALGASGALADFSRTPPPFLLFLVAVNLLAVVTTLSPWGGRLAQATPLRWLIGLQAFRLLPETLLDLAWRDGLAPVQMTFHGRNWDLVSALLALGLAVAWPRLQHQCSLAWAFSGVGLVLLVNVLIIAVQSTPAFVTTFPFIWLPGIQVFAALLLHGVTLRKLLGGARAP